MNTLPKTTVSGADPETGLIQQQIERVSSRLLAQDVALSELSRKLGPIMIEIPEDSGEACDKYPAHARSVILEELEKLEAKVKEQTRFIGSLNERTQL